MVVNPKDRSSGIEAQIISMRQFNFPQIDIFSLLITCRATLRASFACVLTIHSVTDIQVLPVPIQPRTFRFPNVHSTLRSMNREGLAVVVRQ